MVSFQTQFGDTQPKEPFSRYSKMFGVGANLDDTVVGQFFKDMDKLVGSIRWVSNLRKDGKGYFVEYQNLVPANVTKKLLAHGWRVKDINGTADILVNRDNYEVEVERVDTQSSLLVTRVTLIVRLGT